jgi:hypothetical protein
VAARDAQIAVHDAQIAKRDQVMHVKQTHNLCKPTPRARLAAPWPVLYIIYIMRINQAVTHPWFSSERLCFDIAQSNSRTMRIIRLGNLLSPLASPRTRSKPGCCQGRLAGAYVRCRDPVDLSLRALRWRSGTGRPDAGVKALCRQAPDPDLSHA